MPKKSVSVRWASVDPRSGEEVVYDDSDAGKLEAAYQNAKKPSVTLKIGGNPFTIDVKKMTQVNSTGGSRKVKRTEVEVKGTAQLGKPEPQPASTGAGGGAVSPALEAVWKESEAACAEIAEAGFVMGPGLIKLLELCRVDASQVDGYVFFAKLGCKTPWAVHHSEFRDGLSALGVKAPTDVSKQMAAWKNDLKDEAAFRNFFAFCFDFSRNEGAASTIPAEYAVQYLQQILPPFVPEAKFPLTKFCEFLGEKHKKALTKDQWKQIVLFSKEVKPDCSNFDETSTCWNTLFETFADWVRGIEEPQ
jgi:hypothetical protein